MAGLQRSEVSFRRQGSSGLVWDDRFLSGELNKVSQQKDDHQEEHQKAEITEANAATKTTVAPINTVQRSRSNGGYRTGKVSPAFEPPSPKLSACGFCGAFGKTGDKGQRRRKPAKRRSR